MDEIINLVADKTGISKDKAQTAVSTVLGYLKQRLPSPVAGQIDSFLSSGGSAAGGTGGLADAARNVGNMFGSREEHPGS